MSDIFICTITTASLEAFKAKWPCHGFPAEVDSVTFATAGGDLLSADGADSDDNTVSLDNVDGAALKAIIDDASKGYTTHSAPGFISFNRF